ncbi:hypothetical protein ACFX15_013740 [Malus domestica]
MKYAIVVPDPVPQPALASDLTHRLPPRRAAGAVKKKNGRRPRRFDRAGSGDDRATVLDPRDDEYSGGTADWEFGVVLVIAHAVLRKTDDLLVDEENSAFFTTPASSFASSSCNCSIISPVAPPPSSMLRSSY